MDQDTPAHEADPSTPDGVDLSAAWDATRAFAEAARALLAALLGLARSELELARASWPWVFGLLVLLVGLSLSLWVCLIAFAGWSLFALTGSIAWALVALVGLHVALMVAARRLLRRNVINMTLPATRAGVKDLLQRATGERGSRP